MRNYIKKELVNFEEKVKELFSQGKIKGPIHLSVGSEEPLIEVYKNIEEQDWVFSTHRNHYHALLKGMPQEHVLNEILEKRSMHINSKEYKFSTSAIVGGSLPIAVGTAMGIKRKGLSEKVWCFVGDMCAEMGVFHECEKYARRHDLPITFVIEDNGLGVSTPTKKVWGLENRDAKNCNTIKYSYDRKYPHAGCGEWVTF